MNVYHYTARNDNVDILKMLLDFDSHLLVVNARDMDGSTPLHYAARNDHKLVVEMLLNAGVDVNVRDRRGRTAEQTARSSYIKNMIQQQKVK